LGKEFALITEKQLKTITIHPRSFVQDTMLKILRMNLKHTTIIFENQERIPRDKPVIFAMNHPDRYNYVPFSDVLRREEYPAVAIWVKGKYYENPLMAKFFDATNCIPVASRGYLITKDFIAEKKRRPTQNEYRLLRDLVDGKLSQDELLSQANDVIKTFVTRPHQNFDPQSQDYGTFIESKYNYFMSLVMNLTNEVLFDKKIPLLIFPQGTRSVRLTPGHTGIAEVALKTKIPVVPVGCNGSHKLYPGNLPFAKKETVVYRIGEPLSVDDAFAPFAINEDFTPFTPQSEANYSNQFQAVTDLIMENINTLLDPEYQLADDTVGVSGDGAGRFI